jgi:streptogramin lyase
MQVGTRPRRLTNFLCGQVLCLALPLTLLACASRSSSARPTTPPSPLGILHEYPLPSPGRTPAAITSGPDDALWFTEPGGNAIGRITPTGQISEFPLPTANSQPGAITTGPDGALWFTEYSGNRIGRIGGIGRIGRMSA